MVVAAVGSAPVSQQLVHDISTAFGIQRISVCTAMYLQSASVTLLQRLRNLKNQHIAVGPGDTGVCTSAMKYE